jgi:uncharacterized linocin/CFP29 family protein
MHSDLVELGWTEDHLNRIASVVTEEAQKSRVAAQMLPVVGPEDPTTIAVPAFTLGASDNPSRFPPQHPLPEGQSGAAREPKQRLTVDSNPTLFLTTIAVNVHLRSHEVADPELKAALVMFRRAANYIARIEDALVFNGRDQNSVPPLGVGIPNSVYTVTGDGAPWGLLRPQDLERQDRQLAQPSGAERRILERIPATKDEGLQGDDVITAIIRAIGRLDAQGQVGPYACALSQDLFAKICTPTPNLVLPRDRILPFLQGPLVRSSAIKDRYGVVVALSGNPVEIVVASDISVRFLQTTLEPRCVFRVSERVALRIKEENAIAILT